MQKDFAASLCLQQQQQQQHLFTVIPAKTKQSHFVRICANVFENCINFMPNFIIL